MKVFTLPKHAAALEYRALRLPATVLEKRVVVRFLAEDSVLRLGFERALGALDEKAGALLDDEQLTTRGHALRRRSEILGKAVQLETKASARKAAAAAELEAGKRDAERTREHARRSQREGVQQALRDEQAEKKRVEQEAKARLQAEKQRVADEARVKAQAVTAQLDAQEKRIEDTTKARTAAPKAQLKDAVAEKKAADAERAKADRLAELATDERETRKAARQT
jgi:colicin import membrane protein